jgi:hypothetical protein
MAKIGLNTTALIVIIILSVSFINIPYIIHAKENSINDSNNNLDKNPLYSIRISRAICYNHSSIGSNYLGDSDKLVSYGKNNHTINLIEKNNPILNLILYYHRIQNSDPLQPVGWGKVIWEILKLIVETGGQDWVEIKESEIAIRNYNLQKTYRENGYPIDVDTNTPDRYHCLVNQGRQGNPPMGTYNYGSGVVCMHSRNPALPPLGSESPPTGKICVLNRMKLYGGDN